MFHKFVRLESDSKPLPKGYFVRVLITIICFVCLLIGGSEGVPLWLDIVSLMVSVGCLYYWIKIDPHH